MDQKQNILSQFEQNKGFIIVGEMHKAAELYQLDKMLKSNEVQRIKRGVYILLDHQSFDERVLISNMYPNGVFCLYSTLTVYGLTTSIPLTHSIAMGRNTKVGIPDYPPIQVYYWSDASYQLGITEMAIDGHSIKIYDLEKSVCDAIKLRGKIGENITLEVIKNYMQVPHKDLNKLMQYAKLLRIAPITEQYIKPLL
jgi:predicted transcriptional regulator of viral defense system